MGGRGINPSQPQRQGAYFRAISTLPCVTIHEGLFQTKPTTLPLAADQTKFATVLRTEEKGSDVNLATHVLLDAFNGDIDVAVVISDDFDLKEPLSVLRTELGKKLVVVSPRRRKKLSHAVRADMYRVVKEADLLACQLPAAVVEADGGTVHRPADW
mgnify:CR=1 FL=1